MATKRYKLKATSPEGLYPDVNISADQFNGLPTESKEHYEPAESDTDINTPEDHSYDVPDRGTPSSKPTPGQDDLQHNGATPIDEVKSETERLNKDQAAHEELKHKQEAQSTIDNAGSGMPSTNASIPAGGSYGGGTLESVNTPGQSFGIDPGIDHPGGAEQSESNVQQSPNTDPGSEPGESAGE